MLPTFYFKTNELVNYNNINSYVISYLFYLCNIHFAFKVIVLQT